MGKKRRKLLRKKYAHLPWNVYDSAHTKDNSEMIEKVNETKREELFDTIVEEVMEIASMEMLGKVEEKITDLFPEISSDGKKIPHQIVDQIHQLESQFDLAQTDLSEFSEAEISDLLERLTKLQANEIFD